MYLKHIKIRTFEYKSCEIINNMASQMVNTARTYQNHSYLILSKIAYIWERSNVQFEIHLNGFALESTFGLVYKKSL